MRLLWENFKRYERKEPAALSWGIVQTTLCLANHCFYVILSVCTGSEQLLVSSAPGSHSKYLLPPFGHKSWENNSFSEQFFSSSDTPESLILMTIIHLSSVEGRAKWPLTKPLTEISSTTS